MPKSTPDPEALVTRIAALVDAHGAVPRGELKAFRKHLPSLRADLEARGYEVGATVRRPLTSQLEQLLAEGPSPVKGLEKRLAGATPRETKELVARLAAGGTIAVVLRAAGPALALPGTPRITGGELDALLRQLDAAQKLLRRARRTPRAGVLRGDLAAALGALSEPVPPAPPLASTAPPLASAAPPLAIEIARRVRETSLPLRVPDLLRALGVPVELGRSALLDGAARGLFQLEPESGMGRLSREEAELCPPGPLGTRLSWVRAPRAARERGGSAT